MTSASSDVRLDTDGHIAVITLERTAKLNAMTPEMTEALAGYVTAVNESRDLWVAVLTGTGRAFCAGSDIAGLADYDSPWQFGGRLFGGTVSSEQYHYPPLPAIRHGPHGRIANIPARLTGYGERWEGDRCVLWAEGEISQAAIFAEHLVLRRRIEADLGGTEILAGGHRRQRGIRPDAAHVPLPRQRRLAAAGRGHPVRHQVPVQPPAGRPWPSRGGHAP